MRAPTALVGAGPALKVVITGSSGLLGRHVAAAFDRAGHTVLGIDAVPPPADADTAHVTTDVTDLGALIQLVQGAEVLVHVAAIPRPTGRDPGTVFRTNVAATYNAVEAAALAGVRRFVYASSFSVLGYPFFEKPVVPPDLPVDERHPIGAQDAYAVSKWLGEEIVEAAVRRGVLPSAVSLRMPWIQTPQTFYAEVGPRREKAEAARDLWAYLDARDAGDAFLRAAEQPVEQHLRLFLSADDTYMDSPTAPLASRTFPSIRLTKPLLGSAAVIDTTAARTALGWTPHHTWRDYPRPGTETA